MVTRYLSLHWKYLLLFGFLIYSHQYQKKKILFWSKEIHVFISQQHIYWGLLRQVIFPEPFSIAILFLWARSKSLSGNPQFVNASIPITPGCKMSLVLFFPLFLPSCSSSIDWGTHCYRKLLLLFQFLCAGVFRCSIFK